MVLVFGAVPSFLPGVGLPLAKRTKFADVLSPEKTRDVEELHSRLASVTLGLTNLLDHEGLAGIVLSRHLGDLLAGLVQLAHVPLMKPKVLSTNYQFSRSCHCVFLAPAQILTQFLNSSKKTFRNSEL